MRLDQLTHELHAQAEEAAASSPVAMGPLRARRVRQRRRAAVAGSAAAVAVVTAGAVLLGGESLRSDAPAPAPADSPSTPATTSASRSPTAWRTVACNPDGAGGCAVPLRLRYDGRSFDDRSGGRQPVHAPNGVNREVGLSLTPDVRLVLVGASGAGPGSQLVVSIGDGAARPVPAGRLAAVPVPRGSAHEEVVIRETGRPGRDEVLVVEAYAARS